MAKLINEDRPEGKSEDYRFVRNAESGRLFKVKHELRAAEGGDPVIGVSVAAVDADHKALRNAKGEPDIETSSHTLTKVELSDPDFDVEARVAWLLDGAVENLERQLAAREAVARLSSAWSGSAPLALDKRPLIADIPPQDTGA